MNSEAGKLFERALLVEDDAGHAMLARRALDPHIGVIEHVTSLASAQALLRSAQFDLVVTDLYVPDTPPQGLVPEYRGLVPRIPIIVLTSSTALRDAVEAMKQGARDFVVKNFDADFREVLTVTLRRLRNTLVAEAEQLRLERELGVLREVIEASADGLGLIYEDGSFTFMNKSCATFLKRCTGSLKASTAENNLLVALRGPVKGGAALCAEAERQLAALRSGAVWRSEVLIEGKQEGAFDLSITAIGFEGEHTPTSSRAFPQGRRFVVWLRDIGDQKRREKFQREILSTTTHDLKGPLGAILVSAELLRGCTAEIPKAQDLALRVGSAAQGCVNLIDELLSARRIQEGSFVLRPRMAKLAELLVELQASYATMAESRGITLLFEQSDDALMGNVDKLGFQRVIGNLLSNALKFTPRGGEVRVQARAAGEELLVSVQDTGSGMAAAEVSQLFQRFSRLEKHGEVPGTGLGLFVVRHIVTAHGGSLQVASQVGKGTTITAHFPLHPPVNERGELIALDFD